MTFVNKQRAASARVERDALMENLNLGGTWPGFKGARAHRAAPARVERHVGHDGI